MKISSKYLLHYASALLICASVASCADNEMATGERSTLQPGEYPLMLTASVGEMTSRSDGKESWAEGDTIAVRIRDYPNVGCYLLNSDGTVMSAKKSIDWHTTELSTVTAWFPYIDLGQVKTVSIADQSQGFKEYDFLTAVEENQIYTNAVNLNFKHQMAKVTCKILPDDGISDAEWNTVKVSIGGFTKASFSNGTLTGDYADNNKWITPVYDAEASSDKMPVYEALVVPQKMKGEGLIKIDLDVNSNNNIIHKTLVYVLPDDIDELQGGNHYKFTVTVKKDRLEVQSLSASWTDDGGWDTAGPAVFRVNLPEDVILPPDMTFSENVQSDGNYLLVKGNRFTISYEVTDNNNDNLFKGFSISKKTGDSDHDIVNRTITKIADNKFIYYFHCYLLSEEVTLEYGDYVQVGDYYYSDGSWGPLELKGDNTMPVGVVFKAGAGGIKPEDGGKEISLDKPANYKDLEEIHGYAVALNDATENMIKWGTDKTAVKTYGSYTAESTPYSGYNNTIGIKSWGEGGKDYDAVKAAIEYEPMAPDKSSGWYLPTPQQLIDIQNIPDRAELFIKVGGKDVKSGIIKKEVVKPDKIEINELKISYWSSLEVSSVNVYIWCFDEGDSKPNKAGKKTVEPYYVRAVLTF